MGSGKTSSQSGGVTRLYLSEGKKSRQLRSEAELPQLIRAPRKSTQFAEEAEAHCGHNLAQPDVGASGEPLQMYWKQHLVDELQMHVP